MQPDPASGASAPTPDENRIAELVNSIRNGTAGATVDLHRFFYHGARFLIRRRLGRDDVDSQVRSVLDAVVTKIREDNAFDSRNLAGLVRQILVQRFPAHTNGNLAKDVADRPAVTVASTILQTMSPVERDALRRWYVQGEPPESFLGTLRLTPDQFRAIRLRARAEFSTKTHQTNVA